MFFNLSDKVVVLSEHYQLLLVSCSIFSRLGLLSSSSYRCQGKLRLTVTLVLFGLLFLFNSKLSWTTSTCFWFALQVAQGISVLIMTLLVVENLIAIFLIYWLSKAVCREHFNTLVCLFFFTYSKIVVAKTRYFINNNNNNLHHFSLQPTVLLKQGDWILVTDGNPRTTYI